MGGVQNVWGEENEPDNAPSRKFLDPSKRASRLLSRGCVQDKNRALTPEGVKKVPDEGGSETFFGRGILREVFLPPLFSTPPPNVSSESGPPPKGPSGTKKHYGIVNYYAVVFLLRHPDLLRRERLFF